jgi:hypothetical protein
MPETEERKISKKGRIRPLEECQKRNNSGIARKEEFF